MGWNYLSIHKLQRCNRWSLGMDKQFHPTLYYVCNYLSMQVKGGPGGEKSKKRTNNIPSDCDVMGVMMTKTVGMPLIWNNFRPETFYSCYGLNFLSHPVILFSGICYRAPLMVGKHCFGQKLDAVRQQAITWANFDHNIRRHMVLLSKQRVNTFVGNVIDANMNIIHCKSSFVTCANQKV